MTAEQQTLFALNCGATNWRLYRSTYRWDAGKASLIGEPQVSPLTSFTDRKLPLLILLNPAGDQVEAIGETARSHLDDERSRDRVRDLFKPSIGAHLASTPTSHQLRYTHSEALRYFKLLLSTVIEQIRGEKWRPGAFDERVLFTFAYPVHWRMDHAGAIYEDFCEAVFQCFAPEMAARIRFVAEPEGAILALKRQGLVTASADQATTLIIDAGGSTTDIIAGRVNPITGNLEYLGRYGEDFGGLSYDAEIAAAIAADLGLASEQIEADPALFSTLRVFAQRLKESLSRQMLQASDLIAPPQRMISLVLPDGQVCRKLIQLDPTLFNTLTSHLDEAFAALIDRALSGMAISEASVSQAMLVGGGAQLYTIVRHLRDRFGEDKVILADNPEEIVVQGIGLEYGKSFEGYQPTIIFTNATPRPTLAPEATREEKTPLLLVSAEVSYPLTHAGTYRIGRDRINDIQLAGEKLSRFHAELLLEGDCLSVIDLGSTNGTFVNDLRIPPHESHPLSAGDRLCFGDRHFTLTE